ncbi:MAG: flagellar motor switch protein FliG [Thiotrichales bacterium]
MAKPPKNEPAKAEAPAAESKPVSNLTGPERAAVLLMALGEEEASRILRHMEPGEVQSLGSAMTALQKVSREDIRHVLDRFVDRIGHESSISIGSQEYLRKILVSALGRDKANNVLAQVMISSSPRGLAELKWMTPRAIANVIKHEHPQIIAIVLTHLDFHKAGQVLDLLPAATQPEVVVRVATLNNIHPDALTELDAVLQRRFAEEPDVEYTGVGGIKIAAEILNSTPSKTEAKIIEELRRVDQDMSDKLQENMFAFESLLSLDDKGMQTLLRHIQQDKLVLSLKAASEDLRDLFLRNMSRRQAETLREDLDAMGPIKLKDAERSQKEIMAVAERLAEEGQIQLGDEEEEYV